MTNPPAEQTAEPAEAAESILCPSCVLANQPRTDFRARCGAPLSFLATVDPFKQTLSEGFAYRQAIHGAPKKIVVVRVWFLFLPGLVALPTLLTLGAQRPTGGQLALPVGYFALSAAMLYQVTANYWREKRRLAALPPAEKEEQE